MSRFHLSSAEREALESLLQDTRDAGVYRRVLALLEVDRGRPLAALARLLRVGRRTLYHWLDAYRCSGDAAALVDRRGQGRPSVWDEDSLALLQSARAGAPRAWGYQATEWTVPLLQDHLARQGGPGVSATTLRRELHRRGYVWKRPRYALHPDPEREKKTADLPPGPGQGAARRLAL